jgi:hypothetical protein
MTPLDKWVTRRFPLFLCALWCWAGCGDDDDNMANTGGGYNYGGSPGATGGSAGASTAGASNAGANTAGGGGQAGASASNTCTTAGNPANGKSCSDYCASFFTANCNAIVAATDGYADTAACDAACETFTQSQLCCRITHAGYAVTMAANPHCFHAIGQMGLCVN